MIIYKVTNKLTGKIYIGQTVVKLDTRWRQHKAGKGGSYLQNSIKLHGENNFSIEQIDEAKTLEELNVMEQTYIKAFNCLAPNGYNLKLGGDNHKHHPNTRARMSESAKIRVQLPGGSEQFKEALKKAHAMRRGKPSWNKGRKTPEHVVVKLSEAHKGQAAWNKGIPLDVETKRKLSEAMKGRLPTNSKKVFCVTNGKIYASAGEAARALGLRQTGVTAVCRGEYRDTGGKTFRYV